MEFLELLLAAKSGDKESRDLLIEKNMGLVWSVVRRFSHRGYEPEDLFQIGVIGLMKAIDYFDTSYNVKFSLLLLVKLLRHSNFKMKSGCSVVWNFGERLFLDCPVLRPRKPVWLHRVGFVSRFSRRTVHDFLSGYGPGCHFV